MSKTRQEYAIGSSTVTLLIGDLLQSQAQVIVSSDDHRLTMGGGVSRAILNAAGPDLRREADKLANQLTIGDVVVTSAGKLPQRHVFHVITREAGVHEAFDLTQTRTLIVRAVSSCIDLVESMRLTSIAFPAIGTGVADHSPTDVALGFAAALAARLKSARTPLHIELYIHPQSIAQDLEFLEFFRVFDEKSNWADLVIRSHTVAMLHGIRTEARWQESVGRILRDGDHEIHAVAIGYGYLDVLRFLLPIGVFRRSVIERVERELVKLSEAPGNKRISVIAHSFGTFLIANVLARRPDLKLNCLILCGSIVPADYDWQRVQTQLRIIDREQYPTELVLNECGWRDVWPVFAHSVTWGYGSSGRFGFKTGMVKDRFHNMDHSGFFADDFVKTYWLPAISGSRIVAGPDSRPASSLFLQIMTAFHVKYLLLAGVAAAAVWLLGS